MSAALPPSAAQELRENIRAGRAQRAEQAGPKERHEVSSERPQPAPRKVLLPSGAGAEVYTREQLTILYRCSHGELGRLLVRKMAPPPIRVDGAILWFVDEALQLQAQVTRTLERWRK